MTTNPWNITENERKRLRRHKRIWSKVYEGWNANSVDTPGNRRQATAMKRFFLIPVALAVVLAFTGCGTVKSTLKPAVVQSGVAAGVRFGVAKYPTALPAVRVATEVICSAANGTNISPAVIVAAIESSSYESLKTPEAVFITQGIVTLYSAAWNSFASDAVAQSEALPYLQAVCNGGREGLAGFSTAASRALAPGQLNWPQLRFK